MLRRPLTSPLFPYTTLFRSQFGSKLGRSVPVHAPAVRCVATGRVPEGIQFRTDGFLRRERGDRRRRLDVRRDVDRRSEEHTSELQSLRHLVCRLLLEKKKKN